MQAEPTNNNVRIKEFLWNQMPLIALIVLCIIAGARVQPVFVPDKHQQRVDAGGRSLP